MSKGLRTLIIAAMLIVVIMPIVPLVLWSFAESWPFDQILPTFSLTAWQRVFTQDKVATSLVNSALLCLAVVGLSLVLSFYAAKNLGTRRFRGRRLLQLLLLVPSFIPQISIVFGIQKVFSQIGLYNNIAGVLVMMLIFYVPYLTLLLSGVFEAYDPSYELQAASLGVSRWHTLIHVTIPEIRSGLIVACIFSVIGVWAAYLSVAAVAPPSFKTMSLLAFPMINSTNGYPETACVTLLYIIPVIIVLVVFSRLLANDTDRPENEQPGGVL